MAKTDIRSAGFLPHFLAFPPAKLGKDCALLFGTIVWQKSFRQSHWQTNDASRDRKYNMSRKSSVLRQLVFFERYRRRSSVDRPDRRKHEPIPKRNPDRSPETIPQPVVPHPGSDPQPSPYAVPEPLPIPITLFDSQTCERDGLEIQRRGMRSRGFLSSHFEIRRVRRIVPLKSAKLGLRLRNLQFKRKLSLVWN